MDRKPTVNQAPIRRCCLLFPKAVCPKVPGWTMRSVRWTLLAFGLMIMGGISSDNLAAKIAKEVEEEPRLPLALEVFLKKPQARQYELHLHLTNMSLEPVSVDVHDLPWTPPNDSKWLKVLRLEGDHRALTQTSFLGNFGSRRIRLLPGESVQDKIVLNHQIPSLWEDIQEAGVLLRWDCPPSGLKFVCREGAPHALTIPQGDAGEPDLHVIDELVCQKLKTAIGFIGIPPDHDVLFLLTTEAVMMDLARVQALLYEVDDYVRQCQPRWTNSWAVSFFTDKKFAGFVSDLENQPYFEKGLWQQANIGQYASQIRTLFRFPWVRTKANSVYLSVFRKPK